MSRRLEVELTSKREDGSYTWRAAGARQPKGELDGALLYEGAAVGDVVRADAEFAVDGVLIVGVLPPKQKKEQSGRLEILGSGKNEGAVTTQLVEKRGRRDGGRGEGGRGRGRNEGRRGRGDSRNQGGRGDNRNQGGRGDNRNQGGRGDNRNQGGRGGKDRPRNDRPRRDQNRGPVQPKPKRLRAKRIHRDALLRELPELQRPLARIVMRDGIAGLRSQILDQNKEAKAAEQLEIPPKVLEAVGEHLLPKLRTAEWRDNAEAALVGMDEIDLRDLRKVVVSAENGARDDETRALAEQLKTGLTARITAEHSKWLAELGTLLKDGRTVRALRQSSRPPKAGAPLPADLATRLAAAASASMTADTTPDRWGTVLDAVAYSPVRQQVTPESIPKNVTDELKKTAKKLSKRVPHIASLFAPAPAPAPAPAKPAPIPAPPKPAEPAPTSQAPASVPSEASSPTSVASEEE